MAALQLSHLTTSTSCGLGISSKHVRKESAGMGFKPVDGLCSCTNNRSGLSTSSKRMICLASAVQEAQATSVEASSARPSPAELARTLLELTNQGTLSSLSQDGWPLGSLVVFTLDADGRPVIDLPAGSLHEANLNMDNRASLHVQIDLPGGQKPQCTLKGKVYEPSDDMSRLRLDTAWRRQFSSAHPPPPSLQWLEVEEVFLSEDLGESELWFAGPDYQAAEADPLKETASRIVEDANSQHWEDLRHFCSKFAGIDDVVEEASITWVDRLGFDLRVVTRDFSSLGSITLGGNGSAAGSGSSSAEPATQVQKVRIPFPRVVTDDRDARSCINMMAQLAWEQQRRYTPPEVQLGIKGDGNN